MDDLLWPHFQPLWRDLVAASSTNILVAGGYGLFLKQRWKFLKRLSGDQLIVVEMHAQRPAPDLDGITATDKRVKHKPSLGAQGVHGRTNPEAVGSELHPFQFSLDDVNLIVPNPVTWSVMKLTATHDRWVSSQDLASDEASREFSRLQAAKHAQDVYRVIAMMTMEERERANEVVESLIDADACNITQHSLRDCSVPHVEFLSLISQFLKRIFAATLLLFLVRQHIAELDASISADFTVADVTQVQDLIQEGS
jgi:hypothetical protein